MRRRPLPLATFLFASLRLVASPPVSLGRGSIQLGNWAGYGMSLPLRFYRTSTRNGRPCPTNKWFSSVIWGPKGYDMHPRPIAAKAGADTAGLLVGYPQVISPSRDLYVGSNSDDFWITLSDDVRGRMRAPLVDDFSDWSAKLLWRVTGGIEDGGTYMKATLAEGSPFVYVTYAGSELTLRLGDVPQVFFFDGKGTVGFTVHGNSWIAYAGGCVWEGPPHVSTRVFTCRRNGAVTAGLNSVPLHATIALVPDGATRADTVSLLASYACSFLDWTSVSWRVDRARASVVTTLSYTTSAVDLGGTPPLPNNPTGFALLPHQRKLLVQGSAVCSSMWYHSVMGRMQLCFGNAFALRYPFRGVLPFLPPAGAYDMGALTAMINAVVAEGPDGHARGYDTYWSGKSMQRVAVGDGGSAATLFSWLQNTLSDFLTATQPDGSPKSSGLFVYDDRWGSLIGAPASYGSDKELNDHHFHGGYFLQAAARLALLNASWAAASEFGGMASLLVGEVATSDRGSRAFPFLRNFDPYVGHSWARGHARFDDGNNQVRVGFVAVR